LPALSKIRRCRPLPKAIGSQSITSSAAKIEFYLRFENGKVSGDLGPPGDLDSPPASSEVRIQAGVEVLDGMLVGRINAMRAAMTG
jgi:hypothetical protein